MRQYTVVGPERETHTYMGFDRCPGDADFKIIPHGMFEPAEGAFFCKMADLAVAVSEAIRYNQEQFGRMERIVSVTQIF